VKISVSTLGCPAWTLDEILTNCQRYGYDGIELRGIENHLDITTSPYFATPAAIAATKAQIEGAGLSISAIDCSAQFASPQGIEASRAEARAAIDLANALGAGFIRVFGGEATDGESRARGTQRLIEELRVLGDYAFERNVTVLLENHDTYITGADVADILSRVGHASVGALWDVHNSVSAGESISNSVSALWPFLRLVHVKDSGGSAESKADHTYCLLGDGDIPIRESIAELTARGYEGYVSVEWEKLWQPKLMEPEVVFPQYANVLQEYVDQASLMKV
jgi:sugar phosphate isomerase/epimerase